MKQPALILISALLTLTTYGCSSGNLSLTQSESTSQINSLAPLAPITVQVKLDTPPFITSVATGEFSSIAAMDDGKIIKYQTIQKGTTVTATTFVYVSKWVVLESHPTVASEAETILKLVGQGGFAKEYKMLKDRFSTAGLIDRNRK